MYTRLVSSSLTGKGGGHKSNLSSFIERFREDLWAPPTFDHL